MKTGLFAVSAAVAMGVPMAAEAAVVTYEVRGTFENGRRLSGTFEVDYGSHQGASNARNFNIEVSGYPVFTFLSGAGQNNGDYEIDLFVDSPYSSDPGLMLFFPAVWDPTNLRILEMPTGALSPKTLVQYSGGYSRLASGRIGVAPLGGVPEPATWALMILGFGAIGAAMRRRRTSASVRFAIA